MIAIHQDVLLDDALGSKIVEDTGHTLRTLLRLRGVNKAFRDAFTPSAIRSVASGATDRQLKNLYRYAGLHELKLPLPGSDEYILKVILASLARKDPTIHVRVISTTGASVDDADRFSNTLERLSREGLLPREYTLAVDVPSFDALAIPFFDFSARNSDFSPRKLELNVTNPTEDDAHYLDDVVPKFFSKFPMCHTVEINIHGMRTNDDFHIANGETMGDFNIASILLHSPDTLRSLKVRSFGYVRVSFSTAGYSAGDVETVRNNAVEEIELHVKHFSMLADQIPRDTFDRVRSATLNMASVVHMTDMLRRMDNVESIELTIQSRVDYGAYHDDFEEGQVEHEMLVTNAIENLHNVHTFRLENDARYCQVTLNVATLAVLPIQYIDVGGANIEFENIDAFTRFTELRSINFNLATTLDADILQLLAQGSSRIETVELRGVKQENIPLQFFRQCKGVKTLIIEDYISDMAVNLQNIIIEDA